MRNPFVTRRPWAVFMLALLLHPFVAMLYIGRARLAALYLLLSVAVLAVFSMTYSAGISSPDSNNIASLYHLPLGLFGAVHGAVLAWKRPFTAPGPWFSRWYSVVGLPLALVLVLLGNQRCLFSAYFLPTESMRPTLEKNDMLFASRPAYGFGEPARGDVMAFRWNKAMFLKRVIGLPGDRIEIRDSVVILNGMPLKRTQVTYADGRMREYLPDGRSYEIYQLYTVGPYDNIPVQTIPAGRYFVLGDNRENSMDSRFTDLGTIARQDVVGKVSVKFFDGETRRFNWKRLR